MAEGGGLLIRYRVLCSIQGSNPCPSAIIDGLTKIRDNSKLVHSRKNHKVLWAADALVCPNLNSIDSVSLMKEIIVW